MSSLDDITSKVKMYVYIPCIAIILCFYIWWIALYEYKDEFVLGILLILLGLLYGCAICLVMTNHPMYASIMIGVSMIIVIAIAAVSNLEQKDGTQGGTFLCLGITPLISGICFTSVAVFLTYGLSMPSL